MCRAGRGDTGPLSRGDTLPAPLTPTGLLRHGNMLTLHGGPLVTCMSCMCLQVTIPDRGHGLAHWCRVSLEEYFQLLLNNSSMLFGFFNKECLFVCLFAAIGS